MTLFKSHSSYARIDEEDPEERQHLQARFLIYKVLEEADHRRQRRHSKRRAGYRFRRRFVLRLKRLRVIISRAGMCFYRQVMNQVKHLKPSMAVN